MSFILFPSIPLVGPGTITGPLTIASGTLTASAPALNISQTWTTGATFNALLVNITDTSSAADSLLMDLQVSGASKFSVRKDGLLVRLGGANATIDSTGRLVVGNSTYDTSIGSLWTVVANTGALRSNVRSYPLSFGTDVILLGDAANTLALRNGTVPQKFIVYNTESSSLANYERGVFSWRDGTDVLQIGMQKGGTGQSRIVELFGPLDIRFGFGPGVMHWAFDTGNTGNLTPLGNNLYDLGKTGTRVKTGWFATSVVITPVAVAALPAAVAGGKAVVNDALGPAFGAAVVGGGAVTVPVYSDGIGWFVG